MHLTAVPVWQNPIFWLFFRFGSGRRTSSDRLLIGTAVPVHLFGAFIP
jgi:hypothetical protein